MAVCGARACMIGVWTTEGTFMTSVKLYRSPMPESLGVQYSIGTQPGQWQEALVSVGPTAHRHTRACSCNPIQSGIRATHP